MFIDEKTLERALADLYGTAGHLLKIWFTLKHMGLSTDSAAVKIDTYISTPSLERLFSCGASDGRFYIPFAHTPRYLTMKHDASRSIIQTTIQRWASSGSVVTCDPTGFLDITVGEKSHLYVRAGRRYPFGLGIGESGFAREESVRVSVPIKSFAVWYGRKAPIPNDLDPGDYLVNEMLKELHISPGERELIFADEHLTIETQDFCLTDKELFSVCQLFINGENQPSTEVHYEEFDSYARRVTSMVSTSLDQPKWMRSAPGEEVKELLDGGAKCILLYGPPRTGKTRLIDLIIDRNSKDRCTIQIHDGWGYDHLVEGLKPDANGNWNWVDGPLKEAIVLDTHYIVLEEINRTVISQALGEVFSLIEEKYRGEENAITLRSGHKIFIPPDVVFFMTMNTVDKSTEEVDDALMGRVAAVEFPPRSEDLNEMLASNNVPKAIREKIAQLFSEILKVYPLGHGYFAGIKNPVDHTSVIRHYKVRIRPVLFNFLGELKEQELAKTDNVVDDLFGNQ